MNSNDKIYNDTLPKTPVSPSKKAVNQAIASAKASKFTMDLEACEKFNKIFANHFDFIKCFGSDSICSYFKVLDLNKLEACIDSDPYIIIKILNENFRSDGINCSAFKQEYRRFVSLVHPNIMSTRGFDQKNNYCLLMMENLRGELLHDAIHLHHYNNPMPLKKSLSIIHDIASALDFAHSKKVFHGDINPSNVLLSHSGVVKLIDLGLASLFVSSENKATHRNNQLLKLNSSYASPQTLSDHTIDTQDDVFSLSCTAYEILTGCHPYNYQLSTEALEQGLKVKWHKQLSYKQWQALRRGLAFDKQERTQNIRELITELNQEIVSKEIVKPTTALVASIVCGMLVGQNLFYAGNQSPQTPHPTISNQNNFGDTNNLSKLEPSYGENIEAAQLNTNDKQHSSVQASPSNNQPTSQALKKNRKTEKQNHFDVNHEGQIAPSDLSRKTQSKNGFLFSSKKFTVRKISNQLQPPKNTNKKPIKSKPAANETSNKNPQNKVVITNSLNDPITDTKSFSKQVPQLLMSSKTKATELSESLSLNTGSSRPPKPSNIESNKKERKVYQQVIHSVLADQIDITNENKFLSPGEKNSPLQNNLMNDTKQQSVKTENQSIPQIKAFATF